MDLVDPAPGRPLRPRQRHLAGHGGDPGRPLQLGAVRVAGRRGGGAGPRHHRGADDQGRGRRAPQRRGRQDRGALHLLHGRGRDRGPRPDAGRAVRRRRRRRCATSATWRRSSASSSATAASACSGRTSTPTTATPTATWSTWSRAASGCPTSPTTGRQVRGDPRRSTSPTSPGCSTLAGRPDAAADGARGSSRSTPCIAEGHWERAETRDVQKTYNLISVDELRTLAPAFDWDAYITNIGGDEQTLAESVVKQPSFFAHLSEVLAQVADRGLEGLAASPACCARWRRTSPTTSSRPTSTSTAAPSTAPPSCGPAGSAASAWSRARSARRSARSTSPGTSRRPPRR